MAIPQWIKAFVVELADAEDRFRLFETVRSTEHELISPTRKCLNLAADMDKPIEARKKCLSKVVNNIRILEETLIPYCARVGRTAAEA